MRRCYIEDKQDGKNMEECISFYEKSRGGDFLFTKNTADDIGSFTAACVVGVLGAINCEYRQTFIFAMCGIVTFLM